METAAKSGNAPAIQALEGPEFPEQMRYLWDWHCELRMGVRDMMTWIDLRAWQSGADLLAREIEALFYLDMIFRNPPKD